MLKSIRWLFVVSGFFLATSAHAENWPSRLMQDSLKKLGVEAIPLTPKEMDDFVVREIATNAEVIRAAVLKQ
jgi:hypothetical protein